MDHKTQEVKKVDDSSKEHSQAHRSQPSTTEVKICLYFHYYLVTTVYPFSKRPSAEMENQVKSQHKLVYEGSQDTFHPVNLRCVICAVNVLE